MYYSYIFCFLHFVAIIHQTTGGVKTGNLPVRESWFILYQVAIYDALMSDLAKWIRYHTLEVSPDEVEYSIIFAHPCISIIHQICFLPITIKATSYNLTVLFQSYKTI